MHNLAERVRNDTSAAIDLATQVYTNASAMLQTLDRYEEVIIEGKERVKQAELLRPDIDENNADGRQVISRVQEKLDSLRQSLNDVKFVTFTADGTLKEASHTFEKLQSKVNELKQLTEELQDKARKIGNKYEKNTSPKIDEAIELQKDLRERSGFILRQADDVANRTQRLLDDANNGLEGLNRINKSLSGNFCPRLKIFIT